MAEDWGVPDWREADEYAQKLEDDRQWWWEFTRRRPDYRALWAKWSPLKQAKVMRDEDSWRRLALEQYGSDDISPFLDRAPCDDPDWLRITFNMSTLLNPKKSFDLWELRQHFWRVDGAIHRSQAEAMRGAEWMLEHAHQLPPGELQRRIEEERKRERLEEEYGLLNYVFDIGKPLEPQLRHAELHLKAVQEETRGRRNSAKPRRMNWPIFLRALDARDCKASYAEIAAVLHNDDSARARHKGRDTVDAAIRVRDNFPI